MGQNDTQQERARERENGVDLWVFLGRCDELLGKLGELVGNFWLAIEISRERGSLKVTGELLGKFREMLGSPRIVRGKRSHRARNPEKFKVTKK